MFGNGVKTGGASIAVFRKQIQQGLAMSLGVWGVAAVGTMVNTTVNPLPDSTPNPTSTTMRSASALLSLYKKLLEWLIMNIRKIYSSIKSREKQWNYYGADINVPNILHAGECCEFIKQIIKVSEKEESRLSDNIQKILEDDSRRLPHIVSTFFLGLWFYNNRVRFIRHALADKIDRIYSCHKESDNVRVFAYVWFLVTLFHDLGYPAEKEGEKLPTHEIPAGDDIESVPLFYLNNYTDYYKYRESQNIGEHGIWAGLVFDEAMSKIREIMYNTKSTLYWGEELDRVYKNVATVILAHNMWLIRDDNPHVKDYQEYGLSKFIMSSVKDDTGRYNEYKFKFMEYPLFSFFCLIDTIDPIKSTCTLSKVDIQLKKEGKIVIKSNDPTYLENVNRLNEWLAPTTMEGDKVTIYLYE